jgi:hypothetical protein
MKPSMPQSDPAGTRRRTSFLNTIAKGGREALYYSRFLISALIGISAISARAASLDLSRAKIFVANSQSRIEAKAAEMLRDEIEKRTRIGLDIVAAQPGADEVVIMIGTAEELLSRSLAPPAGLEIPSKADGYAIWIDSTKGHATSVCAAGHDQRGTLFAVGRLLRLLAMDRDALTLDSGVRLATAPRYALRGHQMGFRPKTNAYDGWTVAMWEQYFRDMIVFGMNALELVPPRTDDDLDSPLFPKPPMEMMEAMSQLAADYGLEVWIWYPIIDKNYEDPATVAAILKEREETFRRLPRIDAVFVPSGDPGEVDPRYLFPLMAKIKKVLNRYHPHAAIWTSPQNYDDKPKTRGWLGDFYEQLHSGQADWLDGVVFGPAVTTTLEKLRQQVPDRFPIRLYPDITHSMKCQYKVPNWDAAFGLTEGREAINPRPEGYAKIFRQSQQYGIGFISYSEGCNDDFNKVLWSCLGWDPGMNVEEITKEYSRYFIGDRDAAKWSEGLLDLEKNWNGPLLTNHGVDDTLHLFQSLEKDATPQEKLNWRFQQGLYRAYYDAYVKARLEYETDLERQAMACLRKANEVGSSRSRAQAEAILDQVETRKVAPELRAKVFELGEALFQSIHMQLSVPRYQAKEVSRGANLDTIDTPLNNRFQLEKRFSDIRKLPSEEERLAAIAQLVK